ncbi:hypothetical protein YYC_00422 [Plasmodium yoelii 17X]|uniref:1-deoxy-D-xylulose-5-phosphate synthase n=1 Tax=Plasmodium yoelii 17X TaxID=1323249 RepID=V7PVS2_PLAYE|nr:hypothetical protein YYC_00422 [Plasmodium yoelii 17X]
MLHKIPFFYVLCVALIMLIHMNNPFVYSNIKKCNKHMNSINISNFPGGEGNLCGRFKNILPRFFKTLSYKNLSPYKNLEEFNEPNICYKQIDNFKQCLYKNNGKEQVTKSDEKRKTYKNKSKLLFINSSNSPHFNLKKNWNKNQGLNYLFNRKLMYSHENYKNNVYLKIFNSEKKNYSIHSLGDNSTNDDNTISNKNINNCYEKYNGNNLDKYFDKINKYINVDMYKNKYGEEIYNEIVNLYVKRDIPKNYEQKYFFKNVKKSIIFDIDKYNDEEFEKKIQEEFTNNGVLINTINKKYYNKKNIKRMITILNYLPLLKIINTPMDLKNLKKKYLPLLSHELKIFHFFLVNITAGHFSPSLSLLELQLSLLYIFNPPLDEIIYDIGHQTYIHKILTGRKLLFLSLRQKNGISGFLNIFESSYDKFGAGHSSTALSAIQGIYEGDWQLLCSNKKENDILKIENNCDRSYSPNKFYISIIGDGGLTGGMALEALNYISFLNSKVLIIYNDNRQVSLPTNGKCISGNKPIGAISDHLYDFVKKNGQIIGNENLNKVNHYNSKENNINESDKKENIFTNLNYNYIGPIDGNNIEQVIKILEDIKNKGIQKSTILHILTNKSSDFINSKSPINIMHSIKKNEIFKFNIEELDSCHDENNNEQSKKEDNEKKDTILNDNEIFSNETYINVYTKEMLKYLEKNKNIIFISPAMLGGSGLLDISQKYPKNVYDVGISEQHAVTFSASMSLNKSLNVHLHIYSTFMQRAYDQIIHDLNLQKIPLNIIINRSGLVGEDGATHQGIYDLSYLGVLNNSTIISPSNDISLKKALKYCSINRKEGSIYIRLPKVNTLSNSYMENYLNINIMKDLEEIEKIGDPEYARNNYFGKSQIIQMSREKKGKKLVCIFNMGSMLYNIVNAIKEIEKDEKFSEEFSFSIIDMIFLNPMDKNIIDYVINKNKHNYLITYEDNTLGGFYTHFNNYLIEKNYILKNKLYVKNIYFPNHPIEHATYKEQQEFVKMDQHNLIYRIKNYLTNNF